jgi:cell division protein FtsW
MLNPRKVIRWLLFDPSTQGWVTEARIVLGLTLLWLCVGLVVLYSASFSTALIVLGDGLYYAKQQLIWVLLGLALLRLIAKFPLRQIFKFGTFGLFVTIFLLAVTLLFSPPTNGASRWIDIGPVKLQASELIKPFLVLQAAQLFGQWHRHSWKKRRFWLMVLGLTLILILLQPSLSMTMFCGATLWLMAVGAGLPWLPLIGVAALGMVGALLSIWRNPYQFERIATFINPWVDPQGKGFQLTQSLITISSGQVWGEGYGMSQQKTFLPEQYTDFVFSVFAEEFGLVGVILLILGLLIFASVGTIIATKAKDPNVRMVALGSTVVLVGQAFFHIGVASGVLPTTGLTFPFFSYGGSSMLSSLAVAGLLIRAALEMSSAEVIPLSRFYPQLENSYKNSRKESRAERLARISQRRGSTF